MSIYASVEGEAAVLGLGCNSEMKYLNSKISAIVAEISPLPVLENVFLKFTIYLQVEFSRIIFRWMST